MQASPSSWNTPSTFASTFAPLAPSQRTGPWVVAVKSLYQDAPDTHSIVAGTYEIVVREDGSSTNLAYKLELPETPGVVQKELNIESEGSFKISVKVGAPCAAGMCRREQLCVHCACSAGDT